MKLIYLVMTALIAAGSFPGGIALGQEDKCFSCHQGQGDKPSAMFKHDVHRSKGVTCAGCHGGNPGTEDMEKAMDTAAGFIGTPKGDGISKACAGCHSDQAKMKSYKSNLPVNQAEMLSTSVHGKLSLEGKEHILQCTTCHGAHGILPVRDPASPVNSLAIVKTCVKCHADASFMRSYNPSLPVDQLEKYRTSVHGKRNASGDVKTAQCASCHGSHDIRTAKDAKSSVYPNNVPATCSRCHSDTEYMREYQIPTDQFEKFSRGVHGVALLQKNDAGAPACNSCHGNHGASPPGVESVSQVCGTCHALNADLFSSSPHKKAFDQKNLPECETCHGNHEIIAATEKLLGVSPQAVCSRCHSQTENQRGYQVALKMRSWIDSLETSEQKAALLINEAEQKGMEVTEAKFKLRDARQARLQTRTMVHSFDEAKFQEIATKGISIATEVVGEGEKAIDEYYFRRWGLGISTLIITILLVSLYVTIKRIERRQQRESALNHK